MIFSILILRSYIVATPYNFDSLDEIITTHLNRYADLPLSTFDMSEDQDLLKVDNLNPIWASIILKPTSIDEYKTLSPSLLDEKQETNEYDTYNDAEKIMFNILNFHSSNIYLHSRFLTNLIINVIINIFNPLNNLWACDYVRYARYINGKSGYLKNINHNAINYMTKSYSNEWYLLKFCFNDYSTVSQIESKYDELKSCGLTKVEYLKKTYDYAIELVSEVDPFVVHLEIQKKLKTVPKTQAFFYEVVGVSTFLFSKLSSIRLIKIYRHHSKEIIEQKQIEVVKSTYSMLLMYFAVRMLQENKTDVMIFHLMCMSLLSYTKGGGSLFKVAFI